MKDNVVLEVSHLKKYFDLGHGRTLHAVDDVSFSIREGEMPAQMCPLQKIQMQRCL